MEMIDVLKKLEEIAQTRPELVADAVDNVSRTNPVQVQDNVGGMSDVHIGAQEVVGEYADEDGNLKMPKADVLRAMAAEKEKASFPRSYEIETAMAMVNDKFGNDGIAKDDMDGQDESAVGEDTRTRRRYTDDQINSLKQWAKKYSQYKNLEDDNLIEALYDFAFDLGIAQLTFEVGELQAAERKIGKKQEDWEDAEINAAMEMSPISNGLMDELHRIIPGDKVEIEKKLNTIKTMLQKAGLKEAGEEALEGNAFAQAVQQAKAAGMKKGDKFKVGDEEHTLRDSDFEGESTRDMTTEDKTQLFDAEYQGRKVPLNKPMRGDVKKFKVYVKDPSSGNVKKVNFGHGGTSAKRPTMRIRKSNPKARKSFRARHNCANPGPKTKARYWSCRKW